MVPTAVSPRPRRVAVTRYVAPLREGGSLPGLVEGDDDGMYVLKFRGAGQGPRVLAAEWIAGELGRVLGLPIPEVVILELDARLGDAEPDPEIQALIKSSEGTNLGLDFLPGSLPFSPAAGSRPDADFAAEVVWFDALIMNPDRTVRNPNLLTWHGRVWLIDHGAALYVHHTWRDVDAHARRPFERIAQHVLLPYASSVSAADERLAGRLDETAIRVVVDALPDAWLPRDPAVGGATAQRDAYRTYLLRRLEGPRPWVEEADRARSA